MDFNEEQNMSWRDLENTETYFVNDKVTKYGVLKVNSRWNGLISNTRKMLVLTIPFALVILLSIIVGFVASNWFIGVLFFLAGMVFYGLIVNRFVFNSKRNAKLLADQKRIGTYTVSRWNDVVVDEETGQIFNTTGGKRGIRSSFLVTWDNAPILDTSMEAECLVVDRELTPFITELSNMHMSAIKRNVEIQNELSVPLLNAIVNTRATKNEAVKLKMQAQNKIYSDIEMNSQKRYQTVIQVVTDARAKVFDFKASLQSILDSTLVNSAILKNVRIMNYEEIQTFARNESRDQTLDLKHVGRNNDSLMIFKYVDLLSVFDANGREYQYADIARPGDPILDAIQPEQQVVNQRRQNPRTVRVRQRLQGNRRMTQNERRQDLEKKRESRRNDQQANKTAHSGVVNDLRRQGKNFLDDL